MRDLLKKNFSTDIAHPTFDWALLIYRIGIAFGLINTHGMKKVLDFQGEVENIPDPFGFGGFANTVMAIIANIVCAAFVGMGLATRLNALFILGVTATGFLLVHINDPWPVKDVPYMYSLALALIFVLGPGRYSIDNYFYQKMKG